MCKGALEAGACAAGTPDGPRFVPRAYLRADAVPRAGGYGCYIFDMDETLAKYNCVEVYKVRDCVCVPPTLA
jgi:hypothetical protein